MKFSKLFNTKLGCLFVAFSFLVIIIAIQLVIANGVRYLERHLSDTNFYIAVVIILTLCLIFMYFVEKIKFLEDKKDSKETILAIGKILYKNQLNQFKKYLNTNKEERLIDNLFYFGEKKNLNYIVDWKGEMNEGEIIEYIENVLNLKLLW